MKLNETNVYTVAVDALARVKALEGTLRGIAEKCQGREKCVVLKFMNDDRPCSEASCHCYLARQALGEQPTAMFTEGVK